MFEAIALLFVYNASGQFQGKVAMPYPTMAQCTAASPALPDPTLSVQKICVSKNHWEGRAIDKNTPLD